MSNRARRKVRLVPCSFLIHSFLLDPFKASTSCSRLRRKRMLRKKEGRRGSSADVDEVCSKHLPVFPPLSSFHNHTIRWQLQLLLWLKLLQTRSSIQMPSFQIIRVSGQRELALQKKEEAKVVANFYPPFLSLLNLPSFYFNSLSHCKLLISSRRDESH